MNGDKSSNSVGRKIILGLALVAILVLGSMWFVSSGVANNLLSNRYDATGAREAAINQGNAEAVAKPAPVYDATGAMLAAIKPSTSYSPRPAMVYDATGAMLAAIKPSNSRDRHPPVYDATGEMLKSVVFP